MRVPCIGAVLWDVIGRTAEPLARGDDRPGRIARSPGGVALNVAAALAAAGLDPVLIGRVGADRDGADLLAHAVRSGIDCSLVLQDAPATDCYMAIETPAGLFAALADTPALEGARTRLLAPFAEGPLGRPDRPWAGPVVIDGNLPAPLFSRIARAPELAAADLRIASASPGKAGHLRPLLGHPRATLYLNLAEANALLPDPAPDAPAAARALAALGARRAIVTHGPDMAADADRDACHQASPPAVTACRVTGAGDVLLATHLAAELAGRPRPAALTDALAAASAHVAAPAAPA